MANQIAMRTTYHAYHTRDLTHGKVNFPKLSLRDSVAAIEAVGLPAEELEALRRGVGGQFPGWASLPEAH